MCHSIRVLVWSFVACLSQVVLTAAERPPAPQLLPADTVAYLRVANVQDFLKQFRESSGGKLANDDRLRPLIDQLYGSARSAFEEVEAQVGASLDKLLALPQGEFCFALVRPETGSVVPVLLLDLGASDETARTLISRLEARAAEAGATRSTEEIGDTTLTLLKLANEERTIAYFLREGTVIAAAEPGVAKRILATWQTGVGKRLVENVQFASIMRHCRPAEDEVPQISFFVDPIGIAKQQLRGNLAGQAGLALIAGLGLDGLKGIGGTMAMNVGNYDGIMHLHVLLAQPRRGVLEVPALTGGDATPEAFVPSDAAQYLTIHWDMERAYKAFASVYDSVRGQDRLGMDFGRIKERFGVDLEKDVIQFVDGRFTYVACHERPVTLNSQSHLIAFRLREGHDMSAVVQKVAEKLDRRIVERTVDGVKFFTRERENAPNPESLQRRPEPCFGVVDGYFVLCDSRQLFDRAIAARNNADKQLATQLDFKLIASKLRRIPGGREPTMLTFSRPEEGLRAVYDLAADPRTRDRLSKSSENNRFFRALHEALRDNPLPPFEDLAKYVAPGGGLLTSDETGWHYFAFSLKRQ